MDVKDFFAFAFNLCEHMADFAQWSPNPSVLLLYQRKQIEL